MADRAKQRTKYLYNRYGIKTGGRRRRKTTALAQAELGTGAQDGMNLRERFSALLSRRRRRPPRPSNLSPESLWRAVDAPGLANLAPLRLGNYLTWSTIDHHCPICRELVPAGETHRHDGPI